jgi:hypothetical protein
MEKIYRVNTREMPHFLKISYISQPEKETKNREHVNIT